MTKYLHATCTNCTFTTRVVTDATFRCFTADSNHVTFRAKLYDNGSAILSTMVDVLREWVRRGPMLSIKGLVLAVDPTCVLVIQSLGDPECVGGLDMPLVTTVATTEGTTTTTAGRKL